MSPINIHEKQLSEEEVNNAPILLIEVSIIVNLGNRGWATEKRDVNYKGKWTR